MNNTDILAVIIALSVSMTLVITTAIANARLTRSRNEWRANYYEVKNELNIRDGF